MNTARKKETIDPLFLAWKNRTVDFMKAYQEQNVDEMLANCTADCSVAFLPMGSSGQGNVHDVGNAIWSTIIECFPTLDNTVNSVVKENGDVRCEASIKGTQVKDFAGIKSKGLSFEEDHIFIFKMDDSGQIRTITVNWDHENLVKQLTTIDNASRKELLHRIASDYVTKGLGGKNFDAIPYHDEVEFRAPILPGGSEEPMVGCTNIKENWWAPLPDLISGTTLVDTFVNGELTMVTVEFHCHITNPKCTLRIVDRFEVDASGKIIRQENFFDPRDLTNPDWR